MYVERPTNHVIWLQTRFALHPFTQVSLKRLQLRLESIKPTCRAKVPRAARCPYWYKSLMTAIKTAENRTRIVNMANGSNDTATNVTRGVIRPIIFCDMYWKLKMKIIWNTRQIWIIAECNRGEKFFHTYIRCILILSNFICLPTDAQLNCLKNNFKIYIKIDI